MEEYHQTCSNCGKEFLVQVTTMGYPGCKAKEDVICPYCHVENGYRMTDGFVKTYKLEEI